MMDAPFVPKTTIFLLAWFYLARVWGREYNQEYLSMADHNEFCSRRRYSIIRTLALSKCRKYPPYLPLFLVLERKDIRDDAKKNFNTRISTRDLDNFPINSNESSISTTSGKIDYRRCAMMSAIPSLTDSLFTAEGWIFLFLNCPSLLLARSYFSAKERQQEKERRKKRKEKLLSKGERNTSA